MKVLQIAPLWETVPPGAYGGTEAVVHVLVEELVRRGHDVTLWASGDSRTSARLQSCFPRSLRTAHDLECKSVYSWQHAALALKDAADYDIIHNHGGEEVMALSHLAPGAPMLTTMHCLITPDTRFVWDRYSGYYNTISWAQRRAMPEVAGGVFAGVTHNGIDVASFPYAEKKDDYLLFLARISPEKGPHLAVEVARRTGRRLIMAGKVDPADFNFFLTAVAPLIDGDQVRFVGEADAKLKRQLYRNAYCVLNPIVWDEPFGLVMAEAQACGTPVLSFSRGAAPEIIRDGVTGFLVEDVEQMAAAVSRAPQIDPRACRSHVERHFDAPVMAASYLRMYESILHSSAAQSTRSAAAGRALMVREANGVGSTQVA
ncbi:MAG: glycosyltransferase family 4 protein [Dehalococcoidia bacterium]|nr:glycosyltransferase family 4 protein [Dehalococcoidia bacterium]